ncbi:Uncharacterised protein [Chryseobacterium nakagawai]|uniref:DUF6046 domain-containing protein n=1 Tax=Chryseobacterium nakagawai TaxID=1241982 RepID=A0AAD1DQZ8_CHRNA|nr:DUF6046 domain-containing protein [Chryseobacterium nakagawai]AZA90920.1 hypothetical protein EG343_09875 [Chryseobacterium nakagawai]VEH22457.1 Uncharacterised protein [Chryseobacterium nakagawai]
MTNGESIVINLAARYAAAFGIMAISNKINQAVVTQEDNKYNVEVYEDFDPAFEEVTMSFGTDSNRIELSFAKMLEGTDDNNIYAPPLMMNFSREKSLIETQVSGGDAIVIERWGTKPWNIEIRGVLIDVENRNYPSKKIDQLCRLFDHNNVIEVEGVQFIEKNIKNIYLKDVSITPVEGFQDTMQFTLNASSINEVGFTLINPD